MRLADQDSENGLQPVPGSHGMNVPTACTIVIIAGCRLTDNHKKNLRKHFPFQVNTSAKWTGTTEQYLPLIVSDSRHPSMITFQEL